MRRQAGVGAWIGGGALIVGVLVFGVALGRAMASGPAPAEPAVSPPASDGPTEGYAAANPEGAWRASEGAMADVGRASNSSREPVSPEVLRLAVERAPFDEDREPPSRRYVLPGTEQPVFEMPRIELPPPPEFSLLGAVATERGGWAVIRVGDETPRMVATGDMIEGYTVASIEGDAAVMAGMGRTLQVQLNEPSATVAAPQRGRNNRNDRDDDDDDDDRAAALREAQARFQQLGGALGGNLPAAALQMMERLQAGGGIANVEVRDGQIFIQGQGGEQVTVNPNQGTVQMMRQNGAGGRQVEAVRVRPGGNQ
ncbi:MAG: hypothetical protein WEG36_14635 [Gemmatimonadota bacterium]